MFLRKIKYFIVKLCSVFKVSNIKQKNKKIIKHMFSLVVNFIRNNSFTKKISLQLLNCSPRLKDKIKAKIYNLPKKRIFENSQPIYISHRKIDTDICIDFKKEINKWKLCKRINNE